MKIKPGHVGFKRRAMLITRETFVWLITFTCYTCKFKRKKIEGAVQYRKTKEYDMFFVVHVDLGLCGWQELTRPFSERSVSSREMICNKSLRLC